jgi:TP901 family phage tail tape measure protein
VATELAAGYVKLSIKYADAWRQIDTSFKNVEKAAKTTGQNAGKNIADGVTRPVAGAGKKAGDQFSQGFKQGSKGIGKGVFDPLKAEAKKAGGGAAAALTTSLKTAAKAAGGIGLALGAADLIKGVTEAGMSYEKAMNSLQGVTQASGAQMDAARAKAAALGSDVTLAGTSASDAANALVELAKGGMTLDQAMEAVRGTVQLATAGQISAAEAAKTQAAAINMWQLPASDAGKVADLLANAVNASAAEMGDMSQALQQGGNVAAGFGVNIEDTVTALAMFSKWGINGSDAGTMLKTSLQAITDQGNPAQGAIEELGLTLYDAQGKFVGVESMMKQVGEASTRMTQEQFQAATAVLFGSDAMRASMVAANGGADAWDNLKQQIGQAGSAQKLASAQMQGLPGVMEGLKNTWDGLKLAIFGVIDGPLQAVGNFMLQLTSGGGPQWLQDLRAGFTSLGQTVGQYLGPALKQVWETIKGPLGEQIAAMANAFKAALPTLKVVGAVIGGALLLALKGAAGMFSMASKGFTLFYNVLAQGFTNLNNVVGFFVDVFKGAWSTISGVFADLKAAFSATAGFISGVWSGVTGAIKAAFDGILNALKTPLRALGGILAAVPESIGPFPVPGGGAARSLGQRLQGLRRGGEVTGPGGTDKVLAWLTAGEGVVTKNAVAAGGAAIVAAMNAGRLPGFKKGGRVGKAEAFARAAGDGRPYVYGGVGPDGWDCSGYMSSIYAVLTGKDPNKRYFTTESDFEALGFVKGNQPGAFNIGIRRGGGGPNSHMAGTLPDGTNVESGGSDSTTKYGGDASGAADFPLQYYLPTGGDKGGVTGGGGVPGVTPGLGSAGGAGGGGGGEYDDGTGGGSAGSDNPYNKLFEAINEILPDFGQMATIAAGGLAETLLPPGFNNPLEGSGIKSASALIGFLGGLSPDPATRAILGGLSAGMTGNAGGVVDAIKGVIPAPFGSLDTGEGGLAGALGLGGPLASGAVPDTEGGGMKIDNSVHIGENGVVGQDPVAVRDQQNRQQRATARTNLGTARVQ